MRFFKFGFPKQIIFKFTLEKFGIISHNILVPLLIIFIVSSILYFTFLNDNAITNENGENKIYFKKERPQLKEVFYKKNGKLDRVYTSYFIND